MTLVRSTANWLAVPSQQITIFLGISLLPEAQLGVSVLLPAVEFKRLVPVRHFGGSSNQKTTSESSLLRQLQWCDFVGSRYANANFSLRARCDWKYTDRQTQESHSASERRCPGEVGVHQSDRLVQRPARAGDGHGR